jgi:hypothetical protein
MAAVRDADTIYVASRHRPLGFDVCLVASAGAPPSASSAARIQRLHLRNAGSRQHRDPARLRLEVVGCKPGLLPDLAHNVACEVDTGAVDVVQVRQPGRKIDSSRIRSVCAHDTEDEAAVATAQRSHGKTVLYAWVRRIPLAPRQHTGEIGLEIRPVKHRSLDGMPVQHQHAAVPERRVGPPQRVKMRRNLVPPLVRERPRPR